MKRFWNYAGAFAMVVALGAYAGAMTTLQNEERVFEGELISVDSTMNVLTMKGAENREMKFTFTEQTQVIGADAGIKGLTGKAGTRLKINYRAQGESLRATRIEVIPS